MNMFFYLQQVAAAPRAAAPGGAAHAALRCAALCCAVLPVPAESLSLPVLRLCFCVCPSRPSRLLHPRRLAQPDGRRELVTPALSGTILPGITRDSILALAAQWGECEVAERPVTIAEVRAAAHEGRLLEMFGSGTACIVQPVGSLVR
jgi:hypothetical protein